MTARLRGTDTVPWMAYEHLTAWGDMFEQIEDAISTAIGAAVFLGQHGLGRFQRNIEMGAVSTEIWQQGAQYGRLLVHLAGGLEVPRPLLRWPTVNHDGALAEAAALADGIIARFGLASSPSEVDS
jgi:hypothetical protein